MDDSTERLVFEALEYLLAREAIFLEGQIAEGQHLLRASVDEITYPHVDALRGLMEDRDRARELRNQIVDAKQRPQP